MATKNWRIMVMIPEELQKQINELRKIPKYKRMSYSRFLKTMIEIGLSTDGAEMENGEETGV